MRHSSGVFGFASGLILLALATFAVLKFLDMPAGNFLDWIIGIGTFCWLVAVVVVPWNIYFEAREVLNEAKQSKKKDIHFDESQLTYVTKISRWSLVVALTLHFVSAAGFYWLATSQISVVGYYAAGAALLLTFLRPSVRLYEYISYRLYEIKKEILVPREDADTFKSELELLKYELKEVKNLMNEESEESWASKLQKTLDDLKQKTERLAYSLEKLQQDNLRDHQKLADETRHAVAQLTEDGKFIDHIVEIIRFIKKV